MMPENDLTWRALNQEGCELGRGLDRRVKEIEDCMGQIEHKVDRLTWALSGAAITFGTAAIMLAINLLW